MRKYFSWRCIGLHVLTLSLVPAFLLAGLWQYHVALSGNGLSWLYTVEWPFFACYALYMWWELIHDQSTPFDRLWAAKHRPAADAHGTPLHQIPGWARDKTLSRAVVEASIEAGRLSALPRSNTGALGPRDEELASALRATPELDARAMTEKAPFDFAAVHSVPSHGWNEDVPGDSQPVIDVRVVDAKVVVDEDLNAYNRYLADLAWRDPPKRWGSPRSWLHPDNSAVSPAPVPDPVVPDALQSPVNRPGNGGGSDLTRRMSCASTTQVRPGDP